MQRVAIFQFNWGRRFALLFIFALSILAGTLFINPSHANAATTYKTEASDKSGVLKKVKAIKYYNGLMTCTQAPGRAGYFKTTISGTDIEKGPHWWINGGGTVRLGQYIDTWGNLDGDTSCSGENDDAPGWVNDMFSVFGLTLSSDGKATLESLGYDCVKNGSDYTCTNNDINSQTAKKGILYQALHGPYLNGVNPLTEQPDFNAMTYVVALNSLTTANMCKATSGGSANLVTVSVVQPDGSITKGDWSIQNDGGPGRTINSGLPLDQIIGSGRGSGMITSTCQKSADATVSYASDYQKWVAPLACAANFPEQASDATFIAGCAIGRLNPANYSTCITSTFERNPTTEAAMRNACFVGQGLPVDKDGTSSGMLCYSTLAYTDTPSLNACIKGSLNRSDANYCNSEYPAPDQIPNRPVQKDMNAGLRTACMDGQKLAVSGGGIPTDTGAGANEVNSSSPKTSCVIDGVGWIVCSVANFFASVSDGVYGLIQNLLKVPVINTNVSDGTNGVYNAWVIMRNIANVAFVIGFLIIIFSQITSLGVSNYGVKKTLPRLVVAAILVNVSYWLSAVAVDLSNILGTGIYDLMSGVKNSMNIGISSNWGNIIGGLLAGGAVSGLVVTGTVAAGAALIAGGGGMAVVFLAIPLVLSAVLAVLLAAFVLIARQALVVILIILSPLAFVALLLPNTEKAFSKWRSALVSMLIMYPMISIVFGGAQIAGLAIMSTAAQGDAISAALAIVVGQTVMVIPFFFIPTLIMKFSGDNLKGVVSALNSKGKGLIGGISGAARKEGMGRLKRGLNTIKYGENAPTSRFGSAFRKYGRKFDQMQDKHGMADSFLGEARQSATRARLGEEAFATAAAAGSVAGGRQIADRAQAAAEAEELKKALQPLIRSLAGMDPGAKSKYLSDEVAAGGTRSAAALHYSASIGDSGFMRQQIDAANASGNEDLKRQAFEAINANSGALLAKAPDLVKGSAAAFGNVKGADMAGFSKDTAKAYMEHLGTLSGSDLSTALAGFNSAVEDITKSADLQSKFSGDSGTELLKHAAKLSPAVQAEMFGTAAIRSDGKIR